MLEHVVLLQVPKPAGKAGPLTVVWSLVRRRCIQNMSHTSPPCSGRASCRGGTCPRCTYLRIARRRKTDEMHEFSRSSRSGSSTYLIMLAGRGHHGGLYPRNIKRRRVREEGRAVCSRAGVLDLCVDDDRHAGHPRRTLNTLRKSKRGEVDALPECHTQCDALPTHALAQSGRV